jgi:putative FmdB family regulatory protein
MPFYDYECDGCGNVSELHLPITSNPRDPVQCEACGGQAKRKLSKGGSVVFKGTGFYETDYKKKPKETGK